MGTFLDFGNKRGRSGVGVRAFRGLTRSAPSRSRALRKFPDGNFRRSLVGSLRALTSAEMAALRCNAAARIGFRLAALHSVAERVNPRKARPPTPHGPRVLAERSTSPFAACWEKSARLQASARTRTPSLAIFSTLGDKPRWLDNGDRSCGSWRRRRAVRSPGKRGQTASGGTPAHGGLSLRPNGARRGGSARPPPRCISAQPFLQT